MSHGKAAPGSPIGTKNAAEHSAAAAMHVEADPQDDASATSLAQAAPAIAPVEAVGEIHASLATKQPNRAEHVRAIVSDDGSLIFEGAPSPNSSAAGYLGVSGVVSDVHVGLVGLSTDLHFLESSKLY